MEHRLIDPPYLAFPLSVDARGPRLASRAEHIRGQIEQVLFTAPGERVFRPDFGAGVKALLFEPNDSALWALTQQRLTAALAETLRGEVDPKSISVGIHGEGATLHIAVSYVLAAINRRETQRFRLGDA